MDVCSISIYIWSGHKQPAWNRSTRLGGMLLLSLTTPAITASLPENDCKCANNVFVSAALTIKLTCSLAFHYILQSCTFDVRY